MKAIDNLLTSKDTIDSNNSDTFFAIAAYFGTLLTKLCNDNNIQLNILYPIFIVPNEWKTETNDILQQIMIPLLTKAGIHFDTEDNRDRVLFIGQLEANMASIQLRKNSKQLPYIHNENRCIMYDLYKDKRLLKLKANYFQVKEDYNLRLFNEKYYSLNIISMHEITIDDEKKLGKSIEHFLKEFIFKNILKIEHLIETPTEEDQEEADGILDEIIFSFFVLFAYILQITKLTLC
jgi:hypothetical protein